MTHPAPSLDESKSDHEDVASCLAGFSQSSLGLQIYVELSASPYMRKI